MKRIKRRILGLLGLVLVATMTFVAAIMPEREAEAISTVTDTVVVRVIGDVPNVFFTEPTSNVTTTEPLHNIGVSFENITDLRIDYQYTGADGIPTEGVFYTESGLGHSADGRTIPINLLDYGYGKIILSAFGTGYDGATTPFDSVSFTFLPVIASASQNDDNGLVDVTIEAYGDDVEVIEIYLDGELVGTVTRDELEAMPDDGRIVQVSMGDRESGNYVFDIVAKNSLGEQLYLPYKTPFEYQAIPVPDTGRFFQNLNISKEDYLVTGLIIFFTLGIAAFIFVSKNSKKTKNIRKK